MASVLSRRLGKRSLLGTRVSAPGALADGVLVATQVPSLQTDLGQASAHTVLREDGSCAPSAEESSQAPKFPSPGRRQLCAGQQVSKEALGVLCCTLVGSSGGGLNSWASTNVRYSGDLYLPRAVNGCWH